MTPENLVEELLSLPDVEARRGLLGRQLPQLKESNQDKLAELLKHQADDFLRSDVQRCIDIASLLLFMADLTNNPWYEALGLRAKGNAMGYGGIGEYQEAIDCYDQAAKFYRSKASVVLQAATEYAKVIPLANLGRYEEAFEIGRWATRIFQENDERFWLGKMFVNLGNIHLRLGEDVEALDLFDQARDLYVQFENDLDAEKAFARVEQNRGVALRRLGRFDESLKASQAASEMLQKTGQIAGLARAQQNLGATFFMLGRFNEALQHLDKARDTFLADGRRRDAILVELITSDCLLQLRRFPDVIHKCQQIRRSFTELGLRFEIGQSLLNEAVAYSGLERYEEAFITLQEARTLFGAEGNEVWAAMTDLETAVVLLHKNKPEESQEMSLACARIFEAREFTVEKSQALIIAARAAAELGYYDQASDLVHSTLIEAQNQVVPALIYQCHYLLGSLALARGDQQQARVEYDHAVQELERLRGQLMIEFRAAFLEDKQTVYEELVQLCLLLDAPHEGLAYAERAKSRALVELLAFRIDLSIEVRSETDRPLIQELQQLQAERNRLYRRWETSEDTNERGKTTILPTGQKLAQQDIVTLEKEITERWHKLLIRNADYAQDAALWQVHTGPVRPVLDTGTVLIEYFVAQHQLIAFVVADHMVQAYRLDVPLPQIQHLLQRLWLNLRVVPKSSPARHPSLVENAQGILTQLYQHLVAPLRDSIQQSQKLIIVPHGSLHYLPFHAMYDGADYLLSQFEISYLPSSSLMNQTRAPRPVSDLVAVGHAYDGRLPYTALEAMAIAARWQGRCLLEEEATLTNVRAAAAQARILHLATHAVFRPDNPLFSGLALADGWLTTLDIFGLRLQASLVTLSACQTGRSVIGGGDELLGLMRAFMAAGAASIVLTLWAVEDRSTAVLMERFYAHLAAGKAKGAALRQAQLACIHGEEMDDATGREALRHPYFWAPFYLVGDAGFL